jgi:thioredoxin
MNMNIKYILLAFILLGFTACTSSTDSDSSNQDISNEAVSKDTKPADDVISNLQSETEAANAEEKAAQESSPYAGKVRKMNTAEFINEIYDYKSNPGRWVYKGSRPAVIDFYADWCGPCKRVAPIMDKLAKDYAGQIDFIKINTDEEGELSGGVFGIRSIPSILFVPVNGQPQMYKGAFPEQQYIDIINEKFLN